MRAVAIAYRNSATVVEDFDLQVYANTLVALTGPSGGGKSSLLYAAGLMMVPISGDIAIRGNFVGQLTDQERSRIRADHIGYVFQDALLDPRQTILENVLEGVLFTRKDRREHKARAVQMLERLGLDIPPYRRPGQISGGQAHRVAMCRALLKEPDLVLADEPTGNLDKSATVMVLNSLRAAASYGAAVVIATHDPHVIEFCDQIVDLGTR